MCKFLLIYWILVKNLFQLIPKDTLTLTGFSYKLAYVCETLLTRILLHFMTIQTHTHVWSFGAWWNMWYNYIYLFLIPFINIKSWQNYIFNVLQLNLHIKRLHNKTFFYCCFCWSLFTIIIKPQTILIIENNPSIFTFSFRNLSRF